MFINGSGHQRKHDFIVIMWNLTFVACLHLLLFLNNDLHEIIHEKARQNLEIKYMLRIRAKYIYLGCK